MNIFKKVVKQLQRVFAEPKNRGGRPRKYGSLEERLAADARYAAGLRKRKREREKEDARRKAERCSVGQLVKQQDSAGHWHVFVVQAIDAEGHITKCEEVARDANGNPRKYANGHWVYLKDADDEVKLPVPNPAPKPPFGGAPPATPAPAPAPAPVLSRKTEPSPPEPIDNADSLRAFWASRGRLDFKPDITQFFLVNGARSIESASRMGQLAVAIPRWHSDYDEKFSPVTRLWVAMTRSDGAWLQSLLTASPAIREKMRLCVCDDIQALLSLKLTTEIAIFHGQHVTVDGFYESHFKPMPQNAEQVKALLQPPPQQPQRIQSPSELNGCFGGTAYLPPSGWKPKPPSGSNSGGNDGSSCCM